MTPAWAEHLRADEAAHLADGFDPDNLLHVALLRLAIERRRNRTRHNLYGLIGTVRQLDPESPEDADILARLETQRKDPAYVEPCAECAWVYQPEGWVINAAFPQLFCSRCGCSQAFDGEMARTGV